MITIDLELLKNPNFPSLEILESRTKAVLENFNRCRKLNIKLHINDKIEEFSRLFNSITDRRALESLRLSMYAEDVDIYIKLLSEENTSVGVILETLLSLLDAAQERHKVTKKLEEDYLEFFKNFSNEFANVEINLTPVTPVAEDYDQDASLLTNAEHSMLSASTSREIVVRPGNSTVTSEINLTVIPLLFGFGTFVYTFFNPPLILNYKYFLFLDPLFKKGKEYLSEKCQSNQNVVTTKSDQENLQNGDIGLVVVNDKDDSENLIGSVLNETEKEVVFDTKINVNRSTNVNTTPLPTVSTTPTKDVQSGENYVESILNEVEESLRKGFKIPNIIYEDEAFYEFEESTNVVTTQAPTSPIPNVVTTPTQNVETALTKNEPTKNADPNSLINPNSLTNSNSLINRFLTAGFFGILVYYSIRKLMRPAQRLWGYLMNKYNRPKPRQMSYKQQQNIEKYSKILDIKEKLPVIIQNVGILNQFWDNQIINIKSHVETLKSMDENEKIRFPQQIANPIKENWNKQYSESKANYNRMKELVTINSLLSPD